MEPTIYKMPDEAKIEVPEPPSKGSMTLKSIILLVLIIGPMFVIEPYLPDGLFFEMGAVWLLGLFWGIVFLRKEFAPLVQLVRAATEYGMWGSATWKLSDEGVRVDHGQGMGSTSVRWADVVSVREGKRLLTIQSEAETVVQVHRGVVGYEALRDQVAKRFVIDPESAQGINIKKIGQVAGNIILGMAGILGPSAALIAIVVLVHDYWLYLALVTLIGGAFFAQWYFIWRPTGQMARQMVLGNVALYVLFGLGKLALLTLAQFGT